MAMTPKQDIELARAVLGAVEKNLLDPVTGALKPLPDLAGFSSVIQESIAAVEAAGVVIPDEAKKILTGIVAVLAII
jgi:hypothetical protein